MQSASVMADARSLFGIENENTVVSDDPEHRAALQPVPINLIAVLQQGMESVFCSEQVNGFPGVMHAAGHRFYVDAGNYIEVSGPECRTPEDALVWRRAGERILLNALPQAAAKSGCPANSVHMLRCVTDYAGNYSGEHHNYYTRKIGAQDIITSLVPFLVTSFFSCAGGWGPSGFTMSQKRRAVRCVSSQDTRQERGIVHLKHKPLAKSGNRIHLTSTADACMSSWNSYLTLASTGIVLRMLDDGVAIGPAMSLRDPIAALRKLDSDLTWSRPLQLKCGVEASPLDIQEHYLRAAEAYVRSRTCEPWMLRAVTIWRETLDALRHAPAQLGTKLDPFIKLRLYSTLLAEDGLGLRDFNLWCGIINQILPHIASARVPRRGTREFLRERLPFVPFQFVQERIDRQKFSWAFVPQALALWHKVVATDLLYHRIDESGLYWRLHRAGVVTNSLIDDAAVLNAMRTAPAGTRAQVRGQAIRELRAAENGTAHWCLVTSPQRRMVLDDPFVERAVWQPIQAKTAVKTGR